MKRASFATIAVSLIVLSTIVVYSADAAGIPKKAISLASRFIESDLPIATVFTDQANTFSAGLKQIFQASSTTAGIGITGVSSDPSGLSAGDVWFNSGTTNALKFSATGGTQTIVAYTGTCNNNQILVYSTSTNTWSCTNQTSGGITSINSQSGPAITIAGTANNVTVSQASNTVTLNTGQNVVITGGSKQTISKTLNIKGGDFTTSKCSNGYSIKYQSSNSTWICTPVQFTDLNFDTNPSQQISGTGSNITFNNQGGNSGVHSINIGSDVLVKNKPFTITANDIFSGFTKFTGNTQIKGGNFTTSTCPDGQILKYQSSNSTWVCSTFVSSAVTSATGTSGNVTVSASTGAVTWNLGSNVVTTGGSAQRITKQLTIPNPEINGLSISYALKTSSYTLTNADIAVAVNATNTNPTIITLPDATANKNQTFWIKKIDWSTNTVMIKTTSSQLIDGFSNMNITNYSDKYALQSDGSNWIRLDRPSDDMNSYHLKGATGNRWYGSWINQGTPTTLVATANTLNAAPFVLSKPATITKIQLEITSTGAGSTCRMGIYRDNGNIYPSSLVAGSDVGTVSGTSTGVKTNTFASPIKLQDGLYWLASDCSTTVPTLRAIPVSSLPSTLGQISTMGTAVGGTGYQVAFTLAAFPATFPASATITVTAQPEILVLITN